MAKKMTAVDAAFYGFGLIKRDPQTFLGVALLMSALGIYMVLELLPAYVSTMQTLAGAEGDPAAAAAATSELGAAALLILALSIPVSMIILGAMHRALVFGASRGWVLGLKLGMDEVRVIIVTIVGYIMAYLPYIGVIVLAGAVMGAVVMAAAGAGGEGGGLVAFASILLLIPAYIVGLCLMIWIGIRLSLAASASVGEKRFVIFESWKMTKGRFWTLFLAYLLLFAIFFAAYIIVGVAGSVAFGLMAAGSPPDLTALTNISLGPVVVIGAVCYGVLITFLSGGFYGIAARGYQDWKASTGTTIADEF